MLRVKINDKIFSFSFEEFQQVLDRKGVNAGIEILDIC